MWRALFHFFLLFPIAPVAAALEIGCLLVVFAFLVIVFLGSFPS